MSVIHVEIGTHGTTLDFPAEMEDSLLAYVREQGILLADAVTAPEPSETASPTRSIVVEEGENEIVSVVDSWFREQELTPERTDDGVGNVRWEFELS